MSSIRKVIGENLDQKGTVYPSNIQYTYNSYLYPWMTMSLFHSKKMTFLVLSILCSALFAPVCCIINIAMAVLVRFPLGHCRTFIHIKNHRCKNSCIYQHVQILTVAHFCCQRHELEPTSYRWMVPILVAFFAFNELVFAIASASICCCCAPIKTTQVHTLKRRWSPLQLNSDKWPYLCLFSFANYNVYWYSYTTFSTGSSCYGETSRRF